MLPYLICFVSIDWGLFDVQVTSVETIHSNSDCNAVPYLSPELQVFSGLVACGTKQGNIYLLGQ